MAIRRLSNASVKSGAKSSNLWDQVSSVPVLADILVVAGGGGGGNGGGGGGGAGGLLAFTSQSLSGQYTVTIGAGGAGNTNGVDSKFGTLQTVFGGGRGSGTAAQADGGSGGGCQGGTPGQGYAGPPRQGNNGSTSNGVAYNCWPIGGGGGAGAAGNPPPDNNTGGAGGAGVNTYSSWGTATSSGQNISGTYWFAGGGGGGTYGSSGNNGSGHTTGVGGNGGGGNGNTTSEGTAGLVNTGGGGGAGRDSGSSISGGSGIVIVKAASVAKASTGSPSVYNTGGFTYYKFTSSGTITF